MSRTLNISAALTTLGILAASTAAFADVAPSSPQSATTTSPATTAPAAAPTTAPVSTAAPTAPAATATNPLSVTGLLDGYYQYVTGAKSNANTLGGAGTYNERQLTPTLSLAELNIAYAAAPGGFGGKATLIAGDTADINHANFEPIVAPSREGRYKNIQQLYGTYLTTAGYGLDFGKFYTPFGYEVTESNANFNYSRSTVFNLLPFYHTGVRVYTPSFKGFVLTGYVVQALFNNAFEGVSDSNSNKAIIGQIAFTDPNGKFTFIENIGGGTDVPGGTSTKGFLSDTDFTYTVDSADTLGLNYVYEKLEPSGFNKTTTNGWAVYYKHQLDPINAVALRYSGFDAKTDTVGDDKPYDVTATYEIKFNPKWLTRLEYRFDGSNQDQFAKGDGTAQKTQSTFIASEVYTF